MLIKDSRNSQFWIPLFFYEEPYSIRIIVSLIELILYFICGYVVFISVRIMFTVRLFHNNLVYLGTPMFALWYTQIIGKLIAILYRLEILHLDSEIGEQITLLTDNTEKILYSNDSEPIIFGGFLVCHFGFSVVFGSFAVVIERVIASMLIDNYELNSNIYIPVILTTCYQLSAIAMSAGLVFNKLGMTIFNITWITCSLFSAFPPSIRMHHSNVWPSGVENSISKIASEDSNNQKTKVYSSQYGCYRGKQSKEIVNGSGYLF
uniref:Secreted protein n=2 Tax=Caenorhabditis tropicalis TaxID=1561998 RepID=A0A1I7UGS5_9PELO